MTTVSLPKLLTAQQVSEQLNLPLQTVYAMARTGKIPAVRIGSRNYRFSAAALAAWIESGGCSESAP